MQKRTFFISALIASSLLAGSASAAPMKVCDLVTAAQATALSGVPTSRIMPMGDPLVAGTGTRGCIYFGADPVKSPGAAPGLAIQIMSADTLGIGSTITLEQAKLAFSKQSMYPVDLGDAATLKAGGRPGILDLQVLLPGDKEILDIQVSGVNQESDSARVRPVMVQIAKTFISNLPAVTPGQSAAPKVAQGPPPRPASRTYDPGDMPSSKFRGKITGGGVSGLSFTDDATKKTWLIDDQWTARNSNVTGKHVVVSGYIYTDDSRFHLTEVLSAITP
jgi:hypothetical protein